MKGERGAFLLELAIAMALLGMLFVGWMRWQSVSIQQEQGRIEADYFTLFNAHVANYVQNNRAEILEAIASGTSSSECVINSKDSDYDASSGEYTLSSGSAARAVNKSKRTCAIDEMFLKHKGYWSGLAKERTDERLVAIIRQPDESSIDLEVLTAFMFPGNSASNTPYHVNVDKTIESMRQLGQRGGVLPVGRFGPFVGTKNAPVAAGSDWSVDLKDFVNAEELQKATGVEVFIEQGSKIEKRKFQ